MTKLLLAAAVALASSSAAAEAAFRSGPARARLIELYSSEGCSSCPPADAWISTLTGHPRLWKDFVPVVYHVTYWDYLGWKDRFARSEFDARQRAYASGWGHASTYTPGLVLDGEEWRGWGSEPPEAAGAAGILSASVSGAKISARFSPSASAPAYEVYAARLGFGLSSKVTDGENSGRVLKHEFVVLGLTHAAMAKRNGVWTASLTMPPSSAPRDSREGLAVWVAAPDGRPVQAAGGFLP